MQNICAVHEAFKKEHEATMAEFKKAQDLIKQDAKTRDEEFAIRAEGKGC